MKRTIQVSKEKAIEIAMNMNCVPKDVAERYTDSELRECVRLASGDCIKLVPNF